MGGLNNSSMCYWYMEQFSSLWCLHDGEYVCFLGLDKERLNSCFVALYYNSCYGQRLKRSNTFSVDLHCVVLKSKLTIN